MGRHAASSELTPSAATRISTRYDPPALAATNGAVATNASQADHQGVGAEPPVGLEVSGEPRPYAKTWQMPLRARIVIPVLSVLAVGGGVGGVASSPPGKIPGEIPLLALGALIAAVVNLAIFRRAVTIDSSRVIVRNLIRTYTVDLARIVRVRAGDDGVAIYTDTGQKIVARAISQDVLAKTMRWRTAADDLASAIANAARYAAGEPMLPLGEARPLTGRWLSLPAAAGLASLVAATFVGSLWSVVLGLVSLICFMLVGSYWLYRRRERHRAVAAIQQPPLS